MTDPDSPPDFDREFWQQHWRDRPGGPGSVATNPPNPHLVREVAELSPGTALDAGCGAGAEATWLAAAGWRVTAVDISGEALARAAERASGRTAPGTVAWEVADLATWTPSTRFDLVTTHYAHAAIPQLDLYGRLVEWVAPGGTLLVVAHRHRHGTGHGHGHASEGPNPPPEASVTAASVVARLDPADWEVTTALEPDRTLPAGDGREVTLHDVVVRATRRTRS
ncbi:class I SAM-dependent methyltransferase [Nocardioides sp. SYSU D00038]|uniref:class I SAM-dependent methyltransferase n=1 Tax=Nocardioides sp. SYSU D00038 TaxID=2812554 RepID=UPI001968A01B|nr:class I SAM-dependent methyltransferase [Nocardioides sp. SYSU D00038]